MATSPARRLSACLLAVALLAGAALLVGGDRPAPAAAAEGGPNVLVIVTDDQDLRSMPVMENTKRLIGDAGTTFRNSIVSFPLCCPSRATFFTGRYARNHGVRDGNAYENFGAANSLPVWLQNAGYVTGHVGKFVNGYGAKDQTEVPPGWSEWYAHTGRTDQQVYDYLINENGKIVRYGGAPADFKGDVLTRLARGFINRHTPSPTPFFLGVNYTAPHAAKQTPGAYARCNPGAQPAPRHRAAFRTAAFSPPPNFNEANVSDKHKEIRQRKLLPDRALAHYARVKQCRLESLLHVDEGVADLIAALEASGELASTLVIFTSDNGYFMGEHRIRTGKLFMYEEALRVPLMMRGPGVPAGKKVGSLAANIDLAPTILDVTGARPGLPQDGVSLFKLIAGKHKKRAVMIENSRETAAKAYWGVRTKRYSYAEYVKRGRELFDLRKDRFQLKSVDDSRRYRKVTRWMHAKLKKLKRCKGGRCAKVSGKPPKPGRR